MNFYKSRYKPKGICITITFKYGKKGEKILMQCGSDDIISDTIDRFRGYIGDIGNDKTFIFNEKPLNPDLTLSQAGISNESVIYIVPNKKIKKIK